MKGEVKGYYGKSDNPCIIIFYGHWYCVKGSTNINKTYDNIVRGVNVETLRDVDTMSADNPINSLDELKDEVNS